MGVVGDHPLFTNMEVVGGAHIREARKLDSKKNSKSPSMGLVKALNFHPS